MTGATDQDSLPVSIRPRPVRSLYAGNSRAVMQRGSRATASTNWLVVVSGFFEPVFYLLAIGIGLGTLVGESRLPNGHEVPYAAFIAPALLAVSAMNGAIYDSTWNVFFKMNYAKLYEGMLSTSLGPFDVALGEILLALLRGCPLRRRVHGRHAGARPQPVVDGVARTAAPCCSSPSASRASGWPSRAT